MLSHGSQGECRVQKRLWKVVSCLAVLAGGGAGLRAQMPETLGTRIQAVMSRPEFAHSNFGVEFYDLESGKVVYALNENKLFVPASTTKLLTEGAVLATLGASHRFHTRIFRTGPVDKHGTLKGDVVLVASGDPNLSNRVQPDGTLAFVDEDHSYNGPALPGDPLVVTKELARQIAERGIREIEGRVYVDATLLADGGREGGTGVVLSSIIVNDNVIDLIGLPGAKPGDPVVLQSSPKTSYIKFVNHGIMSPAGAKPSFEPPDFSTTPDGSALV